MSESAFGIEHTEISKARRGPRPRRMSAEATAEEQARQAKSQARKAKFQAGARKVAGFPNKVVNTKVSMADIGRGVGQGTAQLGTGIGHALTYKPGLTGAAVLGGGGYALYRHGQKPKPKIVVTKARDRKKGAAIGAGVGAAAGSGATYGIGAWGREAFGPSHYQGAQKVKAAIKGLHYPTAAGFVAGTAGAGALAGAAIGRKKKAAVVKSAFGIEHSEVNKAIRFPGIDTAKAAKLGQNFANTAAKKKAPVTKTPVIDGKLHADLGKR